MAVYILTINGVERPLNVQAGLDFRKVINGPDVFSCTVLSETGAYRPGLSDVVKLSEDGVDIFGGFITKTDETGADGQPLEDIATEIDCVGYADLFEYAHITETFVIGTTIASIAGTLVTNYLSAYGVTLDAGQLTGVSLTEEIATDGVALTDFFDTLLTNTGFAPRINPDKEFILYEPGATAAAFNVVQGTDDQIGDVRVVRSRSKRYNRIIVKYGEDKIVTQTDPFTGNGVLDTFPLTFPIQGPFVPTATQDSAIAYGVVDFAAGPNPTESFGELSAPAGYIWEYDPIALTAKRRSGAVTNTWPFSIRYDVQFPQVTMVEDAADVAANGPFEAVILLPTIYDKALAEAQAAALLARYLSEPTEVTYQTLTLGLEIGTAQTITASDRNISGSFLVSEIHTQILGGSQDLIRTVKAVGGSTFQGTFRELYIRWLNPGGSSATTTIGPSVSTGGGGVPGTPPFSAQYNKNGVFGGAVGSDSSVYLRPDGGGPTYGIPAAAPAIASLVHSVDGVAQAWANTNNPDAQALTLQVQTGGNAFLELDDATLGVYAYGSNGRVDIAGTTVNVAPNSVQFGNFYGKLQHFWERDAIAVRRIRVTSTSYTIDTEASGGGGLYGVHIFDPTANCTVTLPSVTAFMGLPSSGYGRVLEIRNDSALYVVTLDGASSELIFRSSTGRLTLPLMPGASVTLIALDSTGAGWKVLAYDIPPMEKTLTNAQVISLPTATVDIVPAPGSGWALTMFAASLRGNFAANAYTGASTTLSWIVLQDSDGNGLSSYIANDSGMSFPLTYLTTFLDNTNKVAQLLPVQDTTDVAGQWGILAVATTAVSRDNKGIKLFAGNGGVNFGGGNGANTLPVKVYYDVEATT